MIVVRATGGDGGDAATGRDLWYDEAMAAGRHAACPAEPMAAEDPLFILYTSGIDRPAQGRAAYVPAAICCGRR